MTPLTTKSRQPLSHEWRRHSLVRVRRPSWSGHAADSEPARDEQSAAGEVVAVKSQTTQNDIAW